MLNESPSQSFPVVETPKSLPWAFLEIAGLSFLFGIAGDSLKYSPSGFDAYELICIVIGVVFSLVGISLFAARKKTLQISLLPEKLFSQVILALTLSGMSLSVLSGLSLANQSNTKDMFADYATRLPPVESMRFANMIIPFIAGLGIVFLASRLGEKGRKAISAILMSVIDLSKTVPPYLRIGSFAVIVSLIGVYNYATVMREPFAYIGSWDDWTGVVRAPKEKIIISSNEGLKLGCNLCTGDLKPLESITEGDDIGLSFAFGVMVQLNLFRPEIDSYQQFIALLVAGAMVSGAVIVGIGYRSVIAGLTYGIFMSLFSTLALYQSLLITMYWVPGGAAIVTGALVLAFIARAQVSQRNDKWETLLYALGCMIWGFVGGLAYLGRSNAGISMLLPAVLVLLYLAVRYRWYARVSILVVVFLVSIALPILYFQHTLSWRFGEYNPPNPTDTGHSFSHALYVGLGYVTNPQDIRWLDGNGFSHAQAECSPTIVYLSSDYYQCMRNLYIKTILNDPRLLIRNLLAKSESLLQTSITHLSFFWLLPLLVLFIRFRFVYIVLAFTLVMFLLPGILVFPYFSYMLGYGEILIAAIVVGLISFFQMLSTSLTAPVQETSLPV